MCQALYWFPYIGLSLILPNNLEIEVIITLILWIRELYFMEIKSIMWDSTANKS